MPSSMRHRGLPTLCPWLFLIKPAEMSPSRASLSKRLSTHICFNTTKRTQSCKCSSTSTKGLGKIGDLYKLQKVLMTFGEIIDEFNIPRNHFFKYLQLRNFIRTQQNQTLCIPEMSMPEITAIQLVVANVYNSRKAEQI